MGDKCIGMATSEGAKSQDPRATPPPAEPTASPPLPGATAHSLKAKQSTISA
jgi:hypothetical protein